MTALSVNLNKIAVLRNSRGGRDPDPLRAAELCLQAGCDGITVHPRPDARHIRADDVTALASACAGRVELNIEGNSFAPPRDGYPGLLELARLTRPAQCTLVPDGDGQLTSDHGFDIARDRDRLLPLVAALRDYGCRVSVFVDAGCNGLDLLPALGVERIEIYTGPYAESQSGGHSEQALLACRATAVQAQQLGLGVNAGHDLNQRNLGSFLAGVPNVLEVSIGHALIGEALEDGLQTTVRRYLQIIAEANGG